MIIDSRIRINFISQFKAVDPTILLFSTRFSICFDLFFYIFQHFFPSFSISFWFFFCFLITVPPERPVIYEAKRREKAQKVEAYNEGSDVLLVCEVNGGKYFIQI